MTDCVELFDKFPFCRVADSIRFFKICLSRLYPSHPVEKSVFSEVSQYVLCDDSEGGSVG